MGDLSGDRQNKKSSKMLSFLLCAAMMISAVFGSMHNGGTYVYAKTNKHISALKNSAQEINLKAEGQIEISDSDKTEVELYSGTYWDTDKEKEVVKPCLMKGKLFKITLQPFNEVSVELGNDEDTGYYFYDLNNIGCYFNGSALIQNNTEAAMDIFIFVNSNKIIHGAVRSMGITTRVEMTILSVLDDTKYTLALGDHSKLVESPYYTQYTGGIAVFPDGTERETTEFGIVELAIMYMIEVPAGKTYELIPKNESGTSRAGVIHTAEGKELRYYGNLYQLEWVDPRAIKLIGSLCMEEDATEGMCYVGDFNTTYNKEYLLINSSEENMTYYIMAYDLTSINVVDLTMGLCEHTYGEPSWTWTGYEKAVAGFACTKECGYVKNVTATITSTVTKAASCDTAGERVYTAKATFNGKTYTTTKKETIKATGHSYGAPSWTWTGYEKAVARFACTKECGDVKNVTATITSTVTKTASCDTAGERVYTAKATFNGKNYTTTKKETIKATGHSYGTPSWTWTGYTKATAKFTCKNNSSHTNTVTATITNKVTKQATVTTAGTKTYTATATINGKKYTNTKNGSIYLFNKSTTGIQKYNNVLYYAKNGVQDTSFTGFAKYGSDWYYVVKGKVDTAKKDVIKGTVNGQSGWWYVSAGKVQFVDSVEKNSNGWWVIQKGKVNFNYTGFAKNSNGWWYCKGGMVDFNKKDVIKGTVNGQSGWWYVSGGKVQFVDSVEKNSSGWWKCKGGKVDFDFTGIGTNNYGSWYCKGGMVQFNYNGTVKYNGKTYNIKGGKVQ